jgi:hypothetical protein
MGSTNISLLLLFGTIGCNLSSDFDTVAIGFCFGHDTKGWKPMADREATHLLANGAYWQTVVYDSPVLVRHGWNKEAETLSTLLGGMCRTTT